MPFVVNQPLTEPKIFGEGVISTPDDELNASFSPDGKYFFFTSERGFANNVPAKPFTFQEYERNLWSIQNGLGNIYQIDMNVLKLEIQNK